MKQAFKFEHTGMIPEHKIRHMDKWVTIMNGAGKLFGRVLQDFVLVEFTCSFKYRIRYKRFTH
jgi:hypothetical protein